MKHYHLFSFPFFSQITMTRISPLKDESVKNFRFELQLKYVFMSLPTEPYSLRFDFSSSKWDTKYTTSCSRICRTKMIDNTNSI